MSMPPSSLAARDLVATARPLRHVVEFKAYDYPITGAWAARFPTAPGAVTRNGLGQCELLHIAAAHWLAPEPSTELAALLDDATTAGAGVQIRVDGKWQAIMLAGAGARRALARTVPLDTILAARDCAAVSLFDCPAVIARSEAGFDLWVQASYAADLLASFERS
jgi:sarcosine oxidase gamma subunit